MTRSGRPIAVILCALLLGCGRPASETPTLTPDQVEQAITNELGIRVAPVPTSASATMTNVLGSFVAAGDYERLLVVVFDSALASEQLTEDEIVRLGHTRIGRIGNVVILYDGPDASVSARLRNVLERALKAAMA